MHRGGNGFAIGYSFLEPGEISIHDDRWLTYPWGVNGGLPGARSRKIDGPQGRRREEILPSKCDRVKVEPGESCYFNTWGGGGWGDPLEREIDKVKIDVDAGLVTAQGAKRYGVVIDALGVVDEAATKALRAKMAKERGAVKLFDRGFESIEELKSRCVEETGLLPPEQPKFTKWALKAAGGKAA